MVISACCLSYQFLSFSTASIRLIRKSLSSCHLISRHGSLVCQCVILGIQGFMVRNLKIDTKMNCFVLNYHQILDYATRIRNECISCYDIEIMLIALSA